MKRWIISLLVLCFVLTMGYGCLRETKPDVSENEAVMVEASQGAAVTKEQLTEDLTKKTESDLSEYDTHTDDGVTEELYEYSVTSGKSVFYVTHYEEYDSDNNGSFVLEAFDVDGTQVWIRKWKELTIGELPMGTEPVIEGDSLYVGVYGNLYALSVSDGDILWEAYGTGSTTKPLVYDESVYIAGYDNPFLTSVNKKTGQVQWLRSNEMEHFSPVKTWQWKNTIWVACETVEPGELQYVNVDLNGDIVDFRGYARYDEAASFFSDEASSYLGSEMEVMLPENAFDGDLRTAWGFANELDGAGEWIRFSADREMVINSIEIYNGNHRNYLDAKYYGKPLVIRLDFSNGDSMVYRIKGEDQLMNVEKIILTRLVVAYKMKMTVLESLPGMGDGICISEIIIN